ELGLKDVVLVGVSLGAWIAAELAVKNAQRLSALVLVSAVGAKFGERESSDILDVFTQPRARLEELYFHDERHARKDASALSDEELETIARNNESAAHFTWMPYMHNPKLRSRLHRIRIPSLVVWGAGDRIAPPDYGQKFAAAIPGARFEKLEAAGHFPHIEQPDALAARVLEFSGVRRTAGATP